MQTVLLEGFYIGVKVFMGGLGFCVAAGVVALAVGFIEAIAEVVKGGKKER